MTIREAAERHSTNQRLAHLGMSAEDADALRRISRTLRRWSERACGDGHGVIERDETGRPFYHHAMTGAQWPIPDRDAGARRRLAASVGYCAMIAAYVQGDPRGCALYILTADDVRGHAISTVYNRGIAVG